MKRKTYCFIAVLPLLAVALVVSGSFCISKLPFSQATTSTHSTIPKTVTLDQALAHGYGIVHIHEGYPKNIHLAVNDVHPTSLGMAMIDAKEFLGDDFHVSFSKEKTPKGRSYILMMCSQLLQ